MPTLVQNTPPGEGLLIRPLTEEELGQVRSWSFSSLQTYEDCAYRLFIQRIKRIQEPQGEAAARGSRIHDLGEQYVNGTLEEFPEFWGRFKSELEELREEYKAGNVELEGEWGFTTEWKQTGWMEKDTWARIKLDAYVRQGTNSARVIDYKSGRKVGNEIKHAQQCLLYAIAAFLRDPALEYVQTELWYVDQTAQDGVSGERTVKSYTREQALAFLPGFHKRAVAQTTEALFDPSPSKYACKWCSYKEGEYPECRYGVK